MSNRDGNQSFNYTYSAKEQEEIKKIRRKYAAPEEDKMEQLRRLDAGTSRMANTAGIIIGVIGTLIMGTGMSLAMVWQEQWFIPGIIIGVVGIALVSCAYPVYSHVLKKERERIAPEIIRLTDELMK